jgi:hypothetical protein
MAGGPLYPCSVDYGSSGELFPIYYQGPDGNAAPNEWGHGTLSGGPSADRTLGLRFHMPPILPSGTMKLRILALAPATSGAAKLTVSDGAASPAASPGAGGNPSGITLTAESQTTITWAAAEDDRYKEAKVVLSTMPSGGDVLVVAVVFNNSGWTVSGTNLFVFTVIWE